MKSSLLILSAAALAAVALPPALRAIEEEHPKVTNARDTASHPANDAPKKGLAAIKVAGNSIAPEGGMDLPGARKFENQQRQEGAGDRVRDFRPLSCHKRPPIRK